MWAWLLVGLAGLAVLLIVSLCAPFVVVIDADTGSIRTATVRTRWLFGLYRKQVLPGRKRRRTTGRRGGSRLGSVWTIVRTREIRDSLRKLAGQVAPRVKVAELDMQVRLGPANPVMTAILFGAYCAIRPLLKLPSQYHIDVQPSVFAGGIDGRLHCSLKIRPIRLVVPFTRFVFSRPGWALVKMVVFGEKGTSRSGRSRRQLKP